MALFNWKNAPAGATYAAVDAKGDGWWFSGSRPRRVPWRKGSHAGNWQAVDGHVWMMGERDRCPRHIPWDISIEARPAPAPVEPEAPRPAHYASW